MKKKISMIVICVFVISILAGCNQLHFGQGTVPAAFGESSGEALEVQTHSDQEESNLSQEEIDILEYEKKYYSGEFIMEDYHALAELYAKQGKIKKQRDMLEQSLRLYDDREAFEILQNLCINLEEDDEEIQQQAMLLYRNMETPEYQNEAIHVIESEGWFETLMPKLGEGTRKYFLQKDEQPVVFICIGYDENQKRFSDVWFFENEDRITLLSYSGGVVQRMETTLKEGSYDGDFSLWILDGTTGSILNEQGVFDGGVYSGEYSLKIYKNKAAGDPFDLWNNRENMNYTVYKGQADEAGKGNMEQFAAKLNPYPTFQTYSVKKDSAQGASSQTIPETGQESTIRIFDGEIQVFQNGIWVNMGKVEQYMQKDPFYAYADKRTQEGQASEESGIDMEHIKLPDSSNPKDSKTHSQKPAAQQVPTGKPATQKPAMQQPTVDQPQAPEPDDRGSDDGGSDSGGDSDSGNDNEGNSGGGDSDGGTDGGGDNETDVEWTPDLM